MRLDASKLAQPTPLPSLEVFAQDAGLEDSTQREQIAAFEARYGRAAQRQVRRGRLVQRQLEALRWLEGLVAQSPQAGDAIVSWLNPTLAVHLEQVGLFTLAQLLDRINGIGRLWYQSIDGLGVAKAQRVIAWLGEHQQSIGMAVGAHVARARTQLLKSELNAVVAPASDIRPLEKLIVPAELDGSQGSIGGRRRSACSKPPTTIRPSSPGCAPSTGSRLSRRRRSGQGGATGIWASNSAWTGSMRSRTRNAPTARRPSASCSGRSFTSARRSRL